VRQAVAQGALTIRRSVDARYVGQGFDLTLALPEGDLEAADAQRLRAQFERLYQTVYGVTMPDQDVELVTWSVTASSPTDAPAPHQQVTRRAAPAAPSRRRVYEPALGSLADFAVYRRHDLAPGDELGGPALVEEAQTTTVVPASFTAYIDGVGTIVMERRNE
jgi:N-methylhydantoinase A